MLAVLVSVAGTASGQITLNPSPTRVVGQTTTKLNTQNPNLVEGREFDNPQGIALDTSTNPPALYVSDTANSRILGFRSAIGFKNGTPADIVIGQPDFQTTGSQGPQGSRSTGMTAPTSLAVDASGNLYVVDAGNNRILRFPKPFTQSGSQLPDLVIGQSGFTTNGANRGGISASTVAFSTGTSLLFSGITFDASGNLWITDAGNNRILRYPVKSLDAAAAPGPAADLVLGQQDFSTNSFPATASNSSLTVIGNPSGLAFDSAGRLFAVESLNASRGRILVWNPPFYNGQAASRIIGVSTDPGTQTISDLQLGTGPAGLFSLGDRIGVADASAHRLLIYPPAERFTPNTLTQSAAEVAGQKDFFSGSANQGQPMPSASTLSRPSAAAFYGDELYVVDSGNHRVLVLPRPGGILGPATRVLGQDSMDLGSPNLVEGREFNFSAGEAGVAVDLSSNPPHLYVADAGNNRILGFKDLRNIQPGAKADIVIGQPDFQHTLVNYPANDTTKPTQTSLYSPIGLYVDPSGNLYVADTGNGRVLRFPKPFENYKPGVMQPADLVLGQLNFFSKIPDPTARTMNAPYGLAQASGNGLLVSDVLHHRVLYFPGTSDTFTNGMPATIVFGQPDFTTTGSGTGTNQFNAPRHIATDEDDHLYVADSNNGRVLIFDHAPTDASGSFAAITLTTGLQRPVGMHVGTVTGDIWVTDVGVNSAIRFPKFNSLAATNFSSNLTLSGFAPRALTEDAWGNVFIADSGSRVVIHYPGLSALNAANYMNPNRLAPGMIAALYSTGNFHQFGTQPQSATAIPLPKELNGLQVLFNNAAVPLFFAGTDQINFQVPNRAPTSGTADLLVLESATGRLLGATTVSMATAQPGIFTQDANGSGTAVAANEDGKLNTEKTPAIAGHYITFYGTGQGFIDAAPVDGTAPTGAVPSSRPPTVFISPNHVLTGSDVQYAGLAPGLVGVWQVNVKLPADTITLAGFPTNVIILQDSFPSADVRQGRLVQIYVKQ